MARLADGTRKLQRFYGPSETVALESGKCCAGQSGPPVLLAWTRIGNLVLKLKVWKDTRGQDLIEYALMAAFVAVAAGAIMPGVASSISTIFSKVSSVMTAAASQS